MNVAREITKKHRRRSRYREQQGPKNKISGARRRKARSRTTSYSSVLVLVVAILTGGTLPVHGCYIHGSDIGYCEPSLYEDSEFR